MRESRNNMDENMAERQITDFPYVDKKCHSPKEDKACIHWFIEKFGEKPELKYGSDIYDDFQDNIRDDSILQHLKHAPPRNRWNAHCSFSDNELADIKDQKPRRDEYPVNGKRVSTTVNVIGLRKLHDDLHEAIEGSCLSIYVMDKNRYPVKKYYFLNCATKETYGHDARMTFITDDTELVEDIDVGNTLVLSLGTLSGRPFMDEYYMCILPGRQYIQTVIYYD